VAKDMIDLVNDVTRRYYDFVNPSIIQSEPPTPLAAQLPEYFVFESTDNDQQVINLINDLTTDKKQRIIKKLLMVNDKNDGKMLSK
jgi:hypothetical protein